MYAGSLPPPDQLIQDPDDPELFYERREDVGRAGLAYAVFELPEMRADLRQYRRDLAQAERLGDDWVGDDPEDLRQRIVDTDAHITLLTQLKRRVPK